MGEWQGIRLSKTAINTVAFQELFGVSSVTVAISTIHQNRVVLMRSFIQQELQRLGLTHLSQVFLVTSLADGVLDPQEVFVSPVWYTPSHDKPIPLLDMSEE